MLKIHLFVLSLTLFAPLTHAQTKFSQLLNHLQREYADKFTNHPILIFDQDEISLLYARAQAFGDGPEQTRKRALIIQQYVEKKTSVQLTIDQALNYEPYTTVLQNGAYSLPISKSGYSKKTYLMCAVFPASPNTSQELETTRVLDLNTKEAYLDINYAGLKEKLSYEELQLFSIAHELGHCMDPVFLPEGLASYEVTASSVHLAESFAEVMALFILEQEGLHDSALRRALYRNLYSMRMGKWLSESPVSAFDSKLYKSGGATYYLAPVLLKARQMLKEDKSLIQKTQKELIDIAVEVTNVAAYRSRSFSAIVNYFTQGEKKVLKQYRQFALDHPAMFEKTYRDLLTFIDFSKHLLTLISGKSDIVKQEPAPYHALDINAYCKAYKLSDHRQLSLLIDEQRNQLRYYDGPFLFLKSKQDDLDDLFVRLSTCD